MSSSRSPRQRSDASPQRVLALGGAAAITAMALAGSMGFGPGAAARADPASARTVAETAAVTAAPETAPAATGSTARTGQRSGGWLVVNEPNGSDASGSGGAGATSPGASGGAGATSTDASGGTTAAPALPEGSGSGQRVVFDISDQRVWLVDGHDVVQRSYLASGSRRAAVLAPGTYTVYSRSRHALSLNSKETMNYMVRFAHGEHAAIGFHDIPVLASDGTSVQSRSDLGTPLSAGCIRQGRADAKALWQFARMGTTVVVTA